ncbi:hypothetical protein JEM65_12505 [Gelidibacter salicanalis]|uniref:Uncharacterized protein n=1 Tax=Gelidibacter salicanalis TaxID=291193 RepID=A0A934KLP0_9FLAO|nr:hypothetical protein [Gelidibacter salicanalis]
MNTFIVYSWLCKLPMLLAVTTPADWNPGDDVIVASPRVLLSEERMIPTDELDYKYFFYHSDNKSININHYGLEVHSFEQKNEILFSE